jgi:hypothetical protein
LCSTTLGVYGKRFVGRHSSETRAELSGECCNIALLGRWGCGQRPVLPLVAFNLLTAIVPPLAVFSVSNIDADYDFCSLIAEAEALLREKLPFHHALQI